MLQSYKKISYFSDLNFIKVKMFIYIHYLEPHSIFGKGWALKLIL